MFIEVPLFQETSPAPKKILVACLKAYNFIKKRLRQRFLPVNILEIFRKTYFEEHLPTTASIQGQNFLNNDLFMIKGQVAFLVTTLHPSFFQQLKKAAWFKVFLKLTLTLTIP